MKGLQKESLLISKKKPDIQNSFQRHMTPHLKRNFSRSPVKNSSVTRFNTFKDKSNLDDSMEDIQIEPW